MDFNSFIIMIVYYTKQAAILFWQKILLTFILGILGYLTASYHAQDIAINSLLCLIVIDFVLGFGLAVRKGKLSSWRMKLGLGKFILYMFVIVSGYGFDIIVFHKHVEFGLHYFFIVYLAINEMISILEHTADMGVKIPIVSRLKGLQNQLEHQTLFNLIKENGGKK